MTSNLEKYKADLQRLIEKAGGMGLDLTLHVMERDGKRLDPKKKAEVNGAFGSEYQRWYTEAHAVVRQILPQRLIEFEGLYKGDGKRKSVEPSSYTIQDWLTGLRSGSGVHHCDDLGVTMMRFQTQVAILQSVGARFESSLFEIRQLVQADLFDSEVEAARELATRGFLRAAGAVAGVVLEKHLAEVRANHKTELSKKQPTISRLGDLRNLCDHSKDREPTKEEVAELIAGVEKIMKTVF